MKVNIYIYIFVMALVTYLIRMIPLTLIKKKVKNQFICSFLYYVPYATLAAMTFPAILYSTSSPYSAILGFLIAVLLAYKGKSLILVACSACLAVFICEIILVTFGLI
ncbi:MAG: AzlD domain-containing protein [Ruminococcus sp.]|nr:AzlD domain-containing protein [Ruminococcus sp.]